MGWNLMIDSWDWLMIGQMCVSTGPRRRGCIHRLLLTQTLAPDEQDGSVSIRDVWAAFVSVVGGGGDVLSIFINVVNMLDKDAATIRLCSRGWLESEVWSPERCRPVGHSLRSRAHSAGTPCCQKAAWGTPRRCGPSRCCRCWCCPASARPRCWGTRRRTAASRGGSGGGGASTAAPARRGRPGRRSRSRRKPTRTAVSPSHRGLFVLHPGPRLSGGARGEAGGNRRNWDERVNRDAWQRDLKTVSLSSCAGTLRSVCVSMGQKHLCQSWTLEDMIWSVVSRE